MKYCPSCHIDVNTDRITCPLCRTNLETKVENSNNVIYQPYPKFKEREKRRHLFFKILIFLSIFVSIVMLIMIRKKVINIFIIRW